MLVETLNQSFVMALNLLAALVTMVIINPWLGLLLVPVAALYGFIQPLHRRPTETEARPAQAQSPGS